MQLSRKFFIITTALALGLGGGIQISQAAPQPKKVVRAISQTPTITSPKNNARVNSPLTVKGTAPKESKISISIKATFKSGSQDLGTFSATANSSGKWQTSPINLWAPEGAKNLRYEVVASRTVRMKGKTTKRRIQRYTSEKVIVSPAKKVLFVPVAQLTEKKLRALNPRATLVLKPTLKPVLKPILQPARIDPITGELIRPSVPSGPNVTITSPNRNATVDFPLNIKGTAARNSRIQVLITTECQIYGQNTLRRTKAYTSSDNNGKWQTGMLFSIQAAEADGNVTHKISAVRIENDREQGNTASVIVSSQPREFSGLKITSPESNLYQGEEVTSPITVKGRAIKGHTVEIRVQTGSRNAGNYNQPGYSGSRVIKNWFPVTVNSQGHWSSRINIGSPKTNDGRTTRSEYTLTILVRDTQKRSEIKVLHLRR